MAVEFRNHLQRPGIHLLLKLGTARFQMVEHSLRRGEREWVPYEGAGEVCHTDRWHRVVSELPRSAIEGIHVLALACDDADRVSTTNQLAVSGQIGLYAEISLPAPGVNSKSRDQLVKDAQRP